MLAPAKFKCGALSPFDRTWKGRDPVPEERVLGPRGSSFGESFVKSCGEESFVKSRAVEMWNSYSISEP